MSLTAPPPRCLARSWLSALAVLLALLAPRPVRAAGLTYYVRGDTGVDTNDGLSPDTAVKHISKGTALAKNGDRVIVAPGVYAEGDLPGGSPGTQQSQYYRNSFIGDTSGTLVGTAPGPVVIDASGHASGFELNGSVAITIDGFVIYGANNGIYVKSGSHQSQIVNNIVTGNRDNGIYVQDSTRVVVFNNLVYANQRVGILITGNTIGSKGTAVINNTVYGNGDRGIFFSGTTVASPGGLVLNNAIEGNQPIGGRSGLQVNATSLPDFVGAGNVLVDKVPNGTPVDASDIRASTLYAIDPSGPDGVVGGSGFADDDFHFNQTASAQSNDSPILDAGVVDAAALGFATASTRSDGQPDEGIADAGYHYGNTGTTVVPALADLRYAPLYVDPAGSDINTGATPEQALRTLSGAMAQARAGNRVILAPATYHEGDFTPLVKGPGGRDLAIVGSNGTLIDAFGRDRAFRVEAGGWLSLTDLGITGARIAALQVRQASRADLTRVTVSANSGLGVWVQTQSVVSVSDSHLDQNRSGVRGEQDSEVTVSNCTVCASCQEGVRIKDGGRLRVFDSTVELGSDDGISVFDADELTLANTTVGGHQKTGVQVNLTDTVSVTDSVMFDNRGPGLRLLDVPDPVVFDNLIYKNGSSGLVISGDSVGSPRAQVLNNTFYQNANRGLLLGGSNREPPSPNATVLRNIFAGNGDPLQIGVGGIGLQVNRLSLPGFVGDYTLSADTYGPGTPLGDHDIILLQGQSPGFVDPDGPDDVLAGSGVADDDFHLQQLSAGQGMQSLAVDAGGISAIAAGVEHRTTRSDNATDDSVADLGYHYPLTPIRHCDAALAVRSCTPAILGDCDGNGTIEINEIVLGVNIALGTLPMEACSRFDQDGDGAVSVSELVTVIESNLKTK